MTNINEEHIEVEELKMPQENWLEEELTELKNKKKDYTPFLKMETEKIYELTIDFSKPFDVSVDPTPYKNKKGEECHPTKKVIPVMWENKSYIWTLNINQPIWEKLAEIGFATIKEGKSPLVKLKMTRNGIGKDTRYTILRD